MCRVVYSQVGTYESLFGQMHVKLFIHITPLSPVVHREAQFSNDQEIILNLQSINDANMNMPHDQYLRTFIRTEHSSDIGLKI